MWIVHDTCRAVAVAVGWRALKLSRKRERGRKRKEGGKKGGKKGGQGTVGNVLSVYQMVLNCGSICDGKGKCSELEQGGGCGISVVWICLC